MGTSPSAWSVSLPAGGGSRLDRALLDALNERGANLTRSALQRAFAAGQVTSEGRPLRPSQALRAPIEVQVVLVAAPPLVARPEDLPLPVVFEDDDLLVVDKPAGMPVHAGPGHSDGTLVNAVLGHLVRASDVAPQLPVMPGNDDARPGLVHRLDKDTSGLLVLAKHAAAQEHLAAQFRRHDLHRAYLGLVYGVPRWQTQHLDTLHGRDPADRRRFSPAVGTRRAITDAAVVEPLHGAAVVRFELHTGRTHQIRMHARQLGHPILGDVLYGHVPADPRVAAAIVGLGRHALHAAELAIVHPDGRRLSWQSALPAELAAVVAALRDGPPR
ncbi:MAG: RluA family pseudouridine synthase [Deltaproteobacteria bacterium]|nr:RluA family pseudouridine synthase [Deltaproteobacteria bacterium]MBP7285854.1 RluA family pseudouridine synthase [Nannocystaceae bacterium]